MVSKGSHRLRATLALAAFIWSFVLPAVARHPADAAAEAAAHDEPSLTVWHPVTQFEDVLPDIAVDHCDLCHWWRTLGHSTSSGTFTSEVPEPRLAVASADSLSVTPGSVHDLPARGPPVSHLS
jgi:hypothetical protein